MSIEWPDKDDLHPIERAMLALSKVVERFTMGGVEHKEMFVRDDERYTTLLALVLKRPEHVNSLQNYLDTALKSFAGAFVYPDEEELRRLDRWAELEALNRSIHINLDMVAEDYLKDLRKFMPSQQVEYHINMILAEYKGVPKPPDPKIVDFDTYTIRTGNHKSLFATYQAIRDGFGTKNGLLITFQGSDGRMLPGVSGLDTVGKENQVRVTSESRLLIELDKLRKPERLARLEKIEQEITGHGKDRGDGGWMR